MVQLYLLIADAPLCEALVEQVKRTTLGEPVCVASARDFTLQRDADDQNIVIVDEAKTEAETKAALETLAKDDSAPILLFLGRGEDRDGVTETFVKPFRLGHLMARLAYYAENVPRRRTTRVVFGVYTLDPRTRCAFREDVDEPIWLTEKETALLLFLAQSATPVTRQEILAAVWGYDDRIQTHTLETHIYQLRRKLDREGENWVVSDAGTYRLAGRQG